MRIGQARSTSRVGRCSGIKYTKWAATGLRIQWPRSGSGSVVHPAVAAGKALLFVPGRFDLSVAWISHAMTVQATVQPGA